MTDSPANKILATLNLKSFSRPMDKDSVIYVASNLSNYVLKIWQNGFVENITHR